MKQKQVYLFMVILICVCLPVFTWAQVPPPPDPVDTPIDGGLSLLIGAGVLYGMRKVKEQRKEKKNENNIDNL